MILFWTSTEKSPRNNLVLKVLYGAGIYTIPIHTNIMLVTLFVCTVEYYKVMQGMKKTLNFSLYIYTTQGADVTTRGANELCKVCS